MATLLVILGLILLVAVIGPVRFFWLVIALMLILSGVFGCSASQPLQDWEREQVEQEYREQWALCEQIYAAARQPTVHDNHTHPQWGTGVPPVRVVRDDLWANNCRRLLTEAGLWDY